MIPASRHRGMRDFNRWFYGNGTRRRLPSSKRTRQKILERDGRRCQHCGTVDNPTLDHIVPRSKGGTNAQANLQILCQPCNNRKGDAMPEPAA